MKQTESPHLLLCKDTQLKNRIFQYHIDHKFGSIEGLEKALREREDGKRTEVFALIKESLKQESKFHALSGHGQTSCRREISRYLYNEVKAWIRQKKQSKAPAPPVDSNYSGLDKLFNQSFGKISEEIDTIQHLANLGAKTVKSPNGWEVSF